MKTTYQLTKSQRVDARDWMLDCAQTSEEAEWVQNASDLEIERFVASHFENGIVGFLRTYEGLSEAESMAVISIITKAV